MKIAYCLGGEIRTFMNHLDKFRWLQTEMGKMGVEIHFYGHTWTHSYNSSLEDVDFLTKVCHTDQLEIDDWIKQDFINRVAQNWYLPNKEMASAQEYIDDLLLYSRSCYGQLISGHQSLLLPDDSYDIYMRSRWDAVPKYLMDIGYLDQAYARRELLELFVNFNYAKLIPEVQRVEFNDTVFALTPALWKQVTRKSIYDTMAYMLSSARRNEAPLQAHDAWREYFCSFRNVTAHQLQILQVGLMRD